jgi:hypothetical protein
MWGPFSTEKVHDKLIGESNPKKKNLLNKNQRWEPIWQTYKANENTSKKVEDLVKKDKCPSK